MGKFRAALRRDLLHQSFQEAHAMPENSTKELAETIREQLRRMGVVERFAHLDDEALIEMSKEVLLEQDLLGKPKSERRN
jgi:hypothetical protein